MRKGMIRVMQVYQFNLPFKAGDTEGKDEVKLGAFRPRHLFTNTTGPGLSAVDGLYLGNGENLLLNQLIGGPIDAWNFSVILIQQLVTEFLEEHGLVGKSDKFIQDYLDENELTMPGPMRLDLPTVIKGDTVRLTGKFSVDTMTSLMGDGHQ